MIKIIMAVDANRAKYRHTGALVTLPLDTICDVEAF